MWEARGAHQFYLVPRVNHRLSPRVDYWVVLSRTRLSLSLVWTIRRTLTSLFVCIRCVQMRVLYAERGEDLT